MQSVTVNPLPSDLHVSKSSEALQRTSPGEHTRHELELQLVAPSESAQSAADEQMSQSMKPVRSLLHLCRVLSPEPPHCVIPAVQAGGWQVDFPAAWASSHKALLLHVSSSVASALMRLAGH
jgi:hypothetical protein